MEPISKSELARRLEISATMVGKLTAKGGKLAAALTGRHINAQHPSVLQYIAERDASKPPPRPIDADDQLRAAVGRSPEVVEAGPVDDAVPEDLHKYQDLTIRQICSRFGTLAQFEYFLKASKTIEDVVEKQLKNQEKRGELISRELIEKHLIGYVEQLSSRVLNDAPKAIVKRVRAGVKAGSSDGELEKLVIGILSADLKGAKATATKKLKTYDKR